MIYTYNQLPYNYWNMPDYSVLSIIVSSVVSTSCDLDDVAMTSSLHLMTSLNKLMTYTTHVGLPRLTLFVTNCPTFLSSCAIVLCWSYERFLNKTVI